ncbi:MAG: TSUP family transporter [Paracoccus sp. (in: a-proteobacteria)]|uniref:TSUP family transporter n=1 Tax=Paracoccus sp. TaxID=267 RepID=UPI0039E6928D
MSLALLLSVVGVAGALAGVISGLLGVGGGIILVPALYYVYGAMGYHSDHVMQVCVATSIGTIIFNSLRAIQGHHKLGAVDFGLIRHWGHSSPSVR